MSKLIPYRYCASAIEEQRPNAIPARVLIHFELAESVCCSTDRFGFFFCPAKSPLFNYLLTKLCEPVHFRQGFQRTYVTRGERGIAPRPQKTLRRLLASATEVDRCECSPPLGSYQLNGDGLQNILFV